MTVRLSGDQWARALHDFERTAFRFECQGTYHEPYEQQALRQHLAGDEPDLTYLRTWLDDVRRGTDAGRRYSRVRVVTDPITDYLRFELAVTPHNEAAGEDVRVLSAARAAELGPLPGTDFWLFDDRLVTVMHFDEREGFQYADAVTTPDQVTQFLEIRERVWDAAVPFREFVMT
ncbi:DUF6879 family protein [Amycolatopsis sp. cmx-8-4]|uniref:DUF6879 family protein n=1 Tax=Amycolatopsis sp. cmx-8-4 TaxID=2790947 RepID=UPI003979E580